MKVVENDVVWTKTVGNISIKSTELVELIKDTRPENSAVSATIGNTWEHTYTVLETLDEIEQHLPSLKMPFSISVGDIKINFDNFGVELRYNKPDEPTAQAISRRLSEYLPWYLFLFRAKFIFALVPISFVTFFLEGYIGLHETVYRITGGVWIAILAAAFLGATYLDHPRVSYVQRENFWSRNRDKIFVGVIMLVIGALLAQLVPLAFSSGRP